MGVLMCVCVCMDMCVMSLRSCFPVLQSVCVFVGGVPLLLLLLSVHPWRGVLCVFSCCQDCLLQQQDSWSYQVSYD